jgi:hypothetical protein
MHRLSKHGFLNVGFPEIGSLLVNFCSSLDCVVHGCKYGVKDDWQSTLLISTFSSRQSCRISDRIVFERSLLVLCVNSCQYQALGFQSWARLLYRSKVPCAIAPAHPRSRSIVLVVEASAVSVSVLMDCPGMYFRQQPPLSRTPVQN